jgi:DNA-binding transcriptional LysR family regulator
MSLSLRKLTYLVTAARLGKLSSAAEQLHVSQPALSRSIAELESLYGVKIFDRSRVGVSTTAVGDQIVAEAERILKSAENFDRKYKLVGKGEAGHVALGMGSTIAGIFLPSLGGFIQKSNPSAEITTLIRPADALTEALLNNAIDVFFSPTDGRSFPDEIEVAEIGQISLDVVARAGHPIFSRGSVKIEDLAQFPVASAAELPWVRRINPDAGHFICDNYGILINLMLRSDYIVISPNAMSEIEIRSGSAKIVDVDIPVSREMSIICALRRDRTASPLARNIISYMKSLA